MDKFETACFINGLLFINFVERRMLLLRQEADKKDEWLMKFTQTTLDKIEKVLDEAEYIIRYERGNFQSGYCILEQRKVIVLNKFLQLEGRISTLIDIIPQLKITPEALSPEVRRIYDDVLAMHQLKEE